MNERMNKSLSSELQHKKKKKNLCHYSQTTNNQRCQVLNVLKY